MIRKLEHELISADLAATDTMLHETPEGDVLGRIGLEARRTELAHALEHLEQRPERHASAALMFSGAPVLGSLGIRTDFAGGALSRYQDLVAKVLAQREHGNLGQRGVVPHREAATMHVTNVVHGSFGFLLEELDEGEQGPLFPTDLKTAADEAARLVSSFADEDEDRVTVALVDSDPRVLDAAKQFFGFLRGYGAYLRLVSGDIDKTFSPELIEIAAERANTIDFLENDVELEGELVGVLPEAHRFEFVVSDTRQVIDGAVSREITRDNLLDLYRRLVGQRCRGSFHLRRVERAGREPRLSYTMTGVTPRGA